LTATGADAVPPEMFWVRLHDRRVFSLIDQKRAREASQALERAAASEKQLAVRVQQQKDVQVVFADSIPIVQLGEADSLAAGAASLSVHAADVAALIESALMEERRRVEISTTVFSLSLLVLTGLIAFLVIRKTTEVVDRVRGWFIRHPEKIPALRVGGIEVVRPAAFRGFIQVSLSIGHRLMQALVVYLWLLVGLSLFETTRAHTDRLANLVLTPLSALVGRIVAALPLAVVAAISALVVVLLVRFAGLFFGSVARGETTLRWLPPDLADATGVVVRFAIIVGAVLFVAPIITGADEIQARATIAIFVALGLATVPVLASAAAGILVVYGRRLKPGEFVDIGGMIGKVRATTLLEVRLEDASGRELRIPHLYSLLRPHRMLGGAPPATVSISIDPSVPQKRAREVLFEAAIAVADDARVELVSLSADGASYLISVAAKSPDVRAALSSSIADRLAAEGIKLGRALGADH
jgi:small-conductance mechanosensitive channel